jgi:hypothetical protein
MSVHKKRRKTDACRNCHTLLSPEDNFCKHCGQENHDLKVPFRYIILEILGGMYYFDTKFFVTTKAMFTRPGKITKDFNEGRRARYLLPMRMYFFVAFLFFLFAAKLTDKIKDDKKKINLAGDKNAPQEWTLNGKLDDIDDFIDEDSFEEQWKQLPLAQQKVKYSMLLGQIVKDSLQKYNGDLPYELQKQLEEVTLKQDKKTDSIFYANIKGKPLDGWRVSNKVERLSKLGLFNIQLLNKPRTYKDDDLDIDIDSAYSTAETKAVADTIEKYMDKYVPQNYKYLEELKDSLVDKLKVLKTAQVKSAIEGFERQLVADTLKKYSGKLPVSFQVLMLRNFETGIADGTDSDSLLMKSINLTRRDKLEDADTLKQTFGSINLGTNPISLPYSKREFKKIKDYDERQLDSLLSLRSEGYRKSSGVFRWFFLKSIGQSLKLNAGQDDFEFNEARQDKSVQLIQAILNALYVVMFVLMPVVALILLMIFYRLRKYYYEHLIFSVHVHTAVFFIYMIAMVSDYWFDYKIYGWASFLAMIYFWLSLKRVYMQGWFKTSIKFFLIMFVYSTIATLFLVGASVYGFMTF